MSKLFSILLCCYGDYADHARRAIDSVLADPEARARCEVHVGLNQCGPATTALMRERLDRGVIDTLVESRENLNKDPMMRLLVERTRTPYLVWMDDDSYFLPGGLDALAHFVTGAAPFDVAGHIFYVERGAAYMNGYAEFLERRPWFRSHERIADRERIFFATGGLWAARAGYLTAHDFPDRAMVKRQDDLLLADLVIQTGSRLTPFPDELLAKLQINQAPRRGDGESEAAFSGRFEEGRRVARLPEPYASLAALPFQPHGWFSDTNRRHLARIFAEREVRTAIEVGCWTGDSTRFIASMLPADGRCYAVDTWLGSAEHHADPACAAMLPTLFQQFLSNVRHAGLERRVIPIRMRSTEAARALDVRADLVFLDASHDEESVRADVLAWHPHLLPGGVLCGDDWHSIWPGVMAGAPRAAAELGVRVRTEGTFWWLE